MHRTVVGKKVLDITVFMMLFYAGRRAHFACANAFIKR